MMQIMAKRHWVTTLLAVWMFADAALMLLWTIYELYLFWDFQLRPPNQPLVPAPRHNAGMSAGLLVLAIWYNFRLLLSLLPAPHLLQGWLAMPWARRHFWMHSYLVSIWFDLAVSGIAVALGYGLLRMREWARWSYAGLCVLAIVSLGGVQFGLFLWPLTILTAFILPIALLVFLFRRGLSVPPREGSPSPAPSAKQR
ncbi:MAG TPA: hypothetical protein VKE93_10465 [Candidatus Angelobacter sp.]|nr:hypothetical protein [Candidatus Angelobacter sp.]